MNTLRLDAAARWLAKITTCIHYLDAAEREDIQRQTYIVVTVTYLYASVLPTMESKLYTLR